MSAIAGIWQLNNEPVEAHDLHAMMAILEHRGTDASGRYLEGSVGLTHRMLWTTPESLNEKLPFEDQAAGLVITADARLDNRDELIRLLGFTDRPASDIADSHLILAAYQKWGERCPEKLLGDFAFAIWDSRQQILFCARDYFGVKPFYYHYAPNRLFAFAPEMKGLLALGAVPREINEVMIGDYLSLMFEDKAITFYEDILRLPPAHRLIVSRNGIRLESYWQLDPTYELRLGSDEAYYEQYREIFTEAVRARTRSAFPIGTALSGGLDSSAITCTARDLLDSQTPLKTFSMVFEDVPESDERPFIQAIIDKGGFEPHFVHGDKLSPFQDFDRMFWHQDEVPYFAPQLFLHWAMWETARQQGVRVFLDGLIGDNATSQGTGYLNELANRGQWIKLAQELRGTAKLWQLDSTRKVWWKYVKHQGLKPRVPANVMQTYRRVRGRTAPVWRPHHLIEGDFANQIGLEARSKRYAMDDHVYNSERLLHHQMLVMGMIPYAFELTDKGTAAFNLEARYPFSDRRLAEFCLSLPPRLKFHNGYGRLIARHAMSHTLPEKIRWRFSKGDLGPNLERNLLMFERERVEQSVNDLSPVVRQYVNGPALQKSYERYLMNKPEDYLRNFWAAVMFDQSFRYRQAKNLPITKGVIAASVP